MILERFGGEAITSCADGGELRLLRFESLPVLLKRFEYVFRLFAVRINALNENPWRSFVMLVCWAAATRPACDRHSRSAASHVQRSKAEIGFQNIVLAVAFNTIRVVLRSMVARPAFCGARAEHEASWWQASRTYWRELDAGTKCCTGHYGRAQRATATYVRDASQIRTEMHSASTSVSCIMDGLNAAHNRVVTHNE